MLLFTVIFSRHEHNLSFSTPAVIPDLIGDHLSRLNRIYYYIASDSNSSIFYLLCIKLDIRIKKTELK